MRCCAGRTLAPASTVFDMTFFFGSRTSSARLRGVSMLVLSSSLACAIACGDDDASSGASGGGAGGGGGEGPTWEVPPSPEITWEPCDEGGLSIACAHVPVPVDWSEPTGAATTIFVRRIEATEPVEGSVWLLEGGPGAPGAWILSYAEHIHATHPALDVFIPDHRGTGSSTPLACTPITDPPTSACLESLPQEHLLHTNTTSAAFDVAAIASWTAREDHVLLYGRSYGTYWAHRTVSVAASVFAGLVLDSPCDPVDGCPSIHRDAEVDVVGRTLLSHCENDPACAAHITGDAATFASDVIADADAGTCAGAASAGLGGVRLRHLLARLLAYEDGRGLVPAVLVRYARCDAADVAALTTLHTYFEELDELIGALPDFSVPTNYQVMFAEWWDPSFTSDDAEAQLTETVTASGASLRWASAFEAGGWSAPPRDPALRAWSIDQVPTLVLVGGLDSATPAASLEDSRPLLEPHSSWKELAYAGHVDSAGEGAYGECARALIDGFLSVPGAAVEDACIAQVDAARADQILAVSEGTTMMMLGTASAYD